MPVYLYECTNCDYTRELVASQKSTRQQRCKRCGSRMEVK